MDERLRRRSPWDGVTHSQAPRSSEALCSLLWVGCPGHGDFLEGQVWEGVHTEALGASGDSLVPRPTESGRWPPQGQCVGLGHGVCRRTDYKGWGATAERACLRTTAEATGRQVRAREAAGLKGKPATEPGARGCPPTCRLSALWMDGLAWDLVGTC